MLFDLLAEIAESTKKTFTILNAFAEGTEKEDATDTISQLSDRLWQGYIFITSRHNTHIEDSLNEIDIACLTKMTGKNAAIDGLTSEFVQIRMEKDRKLRKWKSHTEHINVTLVHQADGI